MRRKITFFLFFITVGLTGCAIGTQNNDAEENIEISLVQNSTLSDTNLETNNNGVSSEIVEYSSMDIDAPTPFSESLKAAAWNEQITLPQLTDMTSGNMAYLDAFTYRFYDVNQMKLLAGASTILYGPGGIQAEVKSKNQQLVILDIIFLSTGYGNTAIMIKNENGDTVWHSGILEASQEYFFTLNNVISDYTIEWETDIMLNTDEDALKMPMMLMVSYGVSESLKDKFAGGETFQ